jgi:hypothetical protein
MESSAAPAPAPAAAVLEFPETILHESQMAAITLSNWGEEQALEIQHIEIVQRSASSAFIIVVCPMLPLSLLPRYHAQLTVHFNPTAYQGQYSADLVVTATSKDHPNLTQVIHLKGTALADPQKITQNGSDHHSSYLNTEQLLRILMRMEETMRVHQEKTQSQLEQLSTRLDRLEDHLLDHVPQHNASKSFVPITIPPEPTSDYHQQPRRTFGETAFSPAPKLTEVPFPVLEPSFSVSSALSPSPSSELTYRSMKGGSSGDHSRTPTRFFGEEETRTPKTKGNWDDLIHASDPYPPSLQKYTEDLVDRTQDPLSSTPLLSGKVTTATPFVDKDFPLKLSFSEHSIIKFWGETQILFVFWLGCPWNFKEHSSSVKIFFRLHNMLNGWAGLKSKNPWWQPQIWWETA